MQNNKRLELINDTLSDTRFVLDNERPHKGIKKTLFIWIIIYAIVNLFFYAFTEIALMIDFWGTETYFTIFRLLTIVLYSIPPIVFLYFILKSKMTLKEKSFLKIFVFIPILISFSKLLFPLSYYLNTQVLIQLYDTIPLDIILIIIGLLQFYSYFKKNKYLYLVAFSSIYLFLFIVIKMLSFEQSELSPMIIQLHQILEVSNIYSIFIISIGFTTTFMVKREEYEL
jgi:hypothetical protein